MGELCTVLQIVVPLRSLLDVRMATVSTNMMFFSGTLRQREDIMVITLSRNPFAA